MWEAQLSGQREEAANKKGWMFVKPGAEELKEQAVASMGASYLLFENNYYQ